MPTPVIKSFAKRSNKSVDYVESLWKEIIDDVKDRYDIIDGDERLYKLATTILKKRLKLESYSGFAEFYRSIYVRRN